MIPRAGNRFVTVVVSFVANATMFAIVPATSRQPEPLPRRAPPPRTGIDALRAILLAQVKSASARGDTLKRELAVRHHEDLERAAAEKRARRARRNASRPGA